MQEENIVEDKIYLQLQTLKFNFYISKLRVNIKNHIFDCEFCVSVCAISVPDWDVMSPGAVVQRAALNCQNKQKEAEKMAATLPSGLRQTDCLT